MESDDVCSVHSIIDSGSTKDRESKVRIIFNIDNDDQNTGNYTPCDRCVTGTAVKSFQFLPTHIILTS